MLLLLGRLAAASAAPGGGTMVVSGLLPGAGLGVGLGSGTPTIPPLPPLPPLPVTNYRPISSSQQVSYSLV